MFCNVISDWKSIYAASCNKLFDDYELLCGSKCHLVRQRCIYIATLHEFVLTYVYYFTVLINRAQFELLTYGYKISLFVEIQQALLFMDPSKPFDEFKLWNIPKLTYFVHSGGWKKPLRNG